jgi:hypothetical protein
MDFLPTQRLARTDVIQNGLNFLQQDPATKAGFDLPPLFSYIMKVQGVDKLSKFEKAPEQRQYEQALRAWQSVAVEYSKLIGKQTALTAKCLLQKIFQKLLVQCPNLPNTTESFTKSKCPPPDLMMQI